jgi:hypothetical protein
MMRKLSLDRIKKEIRRKRRAYRGRILITGTGRAGTTFIVRVFTELGLDTGFSQKYLKRVEDNIGKAGLEKSLSLDSIEYRPEIVKSPHAVDIIDEALSEGWLKLSLCIIPVRELSAASESRIRVTQRARQLGLPVEGAPGGLWKTANENEQQAILAESFYVLVHALVRNEIPILFAEFPRIIEDKDYFLRTFGPFLKKRYGIRKGKLGEAWESEANPELITIKP